MIIGIDCKGDVRKAKLVLEYMRRHGLYTLENLIDGFNSDILSGNKSRPMMTNIHLGDIGIVETEAVISKIAQIN